MLGYFQHELCRSLERIDFFRFSLEFIQGIHANIPTIKSVKFLDPIAQQPPISIEESDENRKERETIVKAVDTGRPVLAETTLFLPFPVQETTIIAKATGLDDYLIRKIGNDWLDGLLSQLLHEFLLIKRACVDSLTGLLSSLHLEECLDSYLSGQQGTLVLLSVYPKSSSSFHAKKYQHKTVSLLKSFVNERFPIYYLGQSCFAIVCVDCKDGFTKEFAPSLVNFFKRERCGRVHVSTVPLAGMNHNHEPSIPVSESLMKKAWAALHVASRRGPFAFCNSSTIENVDAHPLAPSSIYLKRWLQRAARKCYSFTLLQFAGGREDMAESIVDQTEGKGRLISDEKSHYLYLPFTDRRKIKNIAQNILTVFSKKNPENVMVNVGISVYSEHEKFKSDQLMNCRKALCHAAFLKPGSIVFCDAVSFNISGDIYYGDGDLVQAVREYKRGLQLVPEDGNLLNSLGVCYAQMNKHKAAVDCFQKASKNADNRFMALYNLGLEQQIQEESGKAIKSLRRALECPIIKDQEQARKDISFQLAVLYTQEMRYEGALALLRPWFESERKTEGGGKALKYLGEIYGGLEQNRDAMKYLQRALRYDEYDAEVFGLLGEMYLIENEGDDIALRFCEKGVELNPDSVSLKLRLAKVQIQCGDLEAAMKNLQPCLRNSKTRLTALKQRGILAREQGQSRAAAKWFRKAEQYASQKSK